MRSTIMVSFAVGGLLLPVVMAVGTYLTARQYLIEQRERTATRQAFTDAYFVRDGLLTSRAKVSDVLGAVSPPAGAVIIVGRGDRWFSSSLEVGEDDVPSVLRRSAASGSTSLMWQEGPDGPAVLVAVPLPAANATFFEQVPTPELAATLDALRVVLTVFAVSTALAAGLLGRWAGRRVVAQLDNVAVAATRVASGALDTRLERTEDPDLAPIVTSFNRMVDALQERMKRDTRFAADVSHELRSPLTALITSVHVLNSRRDELPARARQALDLIDRDLTRFQRALEDLLDLGRLEAGAAALVPAVTDARDLVRHALEATDTGQALFSVRTSGTPLTVCVDKSAMHRALVNLIENAERHGDGLTSIAVSGDTDRVLITVEDRGPGVPDDDRERIFERFVRAGSRGGLPGAGLGLSLVAETVRAHGGAVWCVAGPDGIGAQFVVELPAASADGLGDGPAPS